MRIPKLIASLFGMTCLLSASVQPPVSTTGAGRPSDQSGQIVLDSTVLGVTTVSSGMQVPWEISWGPDGWIWYTEQRGIVGKVNPATGQRKELLRVPDVYVKRSTGLLGMAVTRDRASATTYVFLDYTYGDAARTASKVVRYTAIGDTLLNPRMVLDSVPGANGHNGSRLLALPDGTVLLSTGDALRDQNAQDVTSLSGKVLRLNPDGSSPADNPVPGSLVWTWGHRNVQGICRGANGRVYSSEHGLNSDDEVNWLQPGRNYGWPAVMGVNDQPGEDEPYQRLKPTLPLKWWTPTIAPAGLDYYASPVIPEWQNSLLLTTLKECDLRVLHLNRAGDAVGRETVHADQLLGRMRDLCVAPNGDVYVSTSNRDWNPTCAGFPKPTDDRIVRLRKLRTLTRSEQAQRRRQRGQPVAVVNAGAHVYEQYCASCHKKDGQGLVGTYPPLAGSEWIKGAPDKPIDILLKGLSGPITVNGKPYNDVMPAFRFLTDQQIADVLNYVRQSFGNREASLTFKQVAASRAASDTR